MQDNVNDNIKDKLQMYDSRVSRSKKMRTLMAFAVPLFAAVIFTIVIALSNKSDSIFLYVIMYVIVIINSILNYVLLTPAYKNAAAERDAYLQSPEYLNTAAAEEQNLNKRT